jgi:transposase
VPAAAKELGLQESQLYGWRVKARAERDQSETERNQAAEIARLKRKVAERRRPTCLADTIKPFIPFPRQLPKGSARSSAGLVPRVAEQVGLAKEQG